MPGIPNLYEVLSELNEACDYTADTPDQSNCSSRRTSHTSRSSRSPYTLREFYAYLKESHCEENLEFFNKTRRFLVTNDAKSNPLSTDFKYWDEQVYARFVVVDAPAQCNLPQYIIDTFAQCHAAKVRPQQADIVDAIEIVMGMLFDAYSRYLNHIQTNDHYSIASDASATSHEPEQESDEQMSVSQYGLDMEKLNRDIAEMTLTRSTMSISNGSASTHTLQQQKPRTVPKHTSVPVPVQPQHKANFITKGRMFLHRLQKHRSPSPKAGSKPIQTKPKTTAKKTQRNSVATITN